MRVASLKIPLFEVPMLPLSALVKSAIRVSSSSPPSILLPLSTPVPFPKLITSLPAPVCTVPTVPVPALIRSLPLPVLRVPIFSKFFASVS